MTDFRQYLTNGRTEHDAAIAFLKTLRGSGVNIHPRNVPNFVRIGMENRPLSEVRNAVESTLLDVYEHADDFVAALADAGFHLDYGALKTDPLIHGKNVDHDRTLADMRRKSPIRMAISTQAAQAELYLSHLKERGIKLTGERRLARILPRAYHPLLLDPNFALRVAKQTGNCLARCIPNYSNTHPGVNRFMFANGIFYDDYSGALEKGAKSAGIGISDGPCSECAPIYWESMVGTPFPRSRKRD